MTFERSLTIAIASHERRAELARLLAGLAEELAADEALRAGTDVVAVLDGSADGSLELVRGLELPVPLRAVWQPRRGLAAARNAGLAAASGDVVLFLDDDLVPGPGLVRRHREAHEPGRRELLQGVCLLPPDAATSRHAKAFWEERTGELAAAGRVERFDRFSAANTSGPVEVFRAVGGFDETFVEYGYEDYELAVRLLAAGVTVRFDERAVAYHRQERTVAGLASRARSEGRNAVRLARLHPETAASLFPPGGSRRPYRRLGTAGARGPRRLALAARLFVAGALGEERLDPRRRHRFADHAWAAAYAAGVAEADPDGTLLARLFAADD